MGRRIEAGSVSLNELDTYIQESTSLTANTSGRQEMLENLINRYI
jgi:xylose isomerase